MSTTKKLSQVYANERIVIIDEELLKTIPSLKGIELICSVCKKQSGRIYFQYIESDNNRKGTLKVPFARNPEVEVLGKSDIVTLSMFLRMNRFAQHKPVSVRLQVDGNYKTFDLLPDFWQQTYTNIRLKHLKSCGRNYSVPGANRVAESV